MPTAYYLPETKAAVGALVYSLFHWKFDTLNRPSNTQHYLSITQNQQLLFENSWQIFSGSNKWITTGSIDISRFPELYFGIGNHESMPMPILYGANRYAFRNQILRHLGKSTYIGFNTHSEHLDCIHDGKNNMVMNKNGLLSSLQDYTVTGVGPSFVFDSRDFTMTPGFGSFLEVQYRFYKNFNANPFSIFTLDARHFFPIPGLKSVLAINGIYSQCVGNAPFRLIPSLGGAGMMRGTYAGRYRDKIAIAFQSELRMKVYKRFGIAIFCGVGNVSNQPEGLADHLKMSYGTGIRFRLRKNDNVNLRVDYARSQYSDGLYIVLAEAF